jgi:hypothetical protein
MSSSLSRELVLVLWLALAFGLAFTLYARIRTCHTRHTHGRMTPAATMGLALAPALTAVTALPSDSELLHGDDADCIELPCNYGSDSEMSMHGMFSTQTYCL